MGIDTRTLNRALQESMNETLDALASLTDEQLEAACSHPCGGGPNRTHSIGHLLANDIDHDRMHAGQILSHRHDRVWPVSVGAAGVVGCRHSSSGHRVLVHAVAGWRRTMTRTLPDAVVMAVTELGGAVADWCLEGRDQSLEAHEAAVLERVRRALPALLRAVVGVATHGLAPRARGIPTPCTGCGQPTAPREGARPRTIATQCGTLTLTRPWYHCAPCGQSCSAVETVLAVPARARLSGGLHAWVVLVGATAVFRDGATLLAS